MPCFTSPSCICSDLKKLLAAVAFGVVLCSMCACQVHLEHPAFDSGQAEMLVSFATLALQSNTTSSLSAPNSQDWSWAVSSETDATIQIDALCKKWPDTTVTFLISRDAQLVRVWAEGPCQAFVENLFRDKRERLSNCLFFPQKNVFAVGMSGDRVTSTTRKNRG